MRASAILLGVRVYLITAALLHIARNKARLFKWRLCMYLRYRRCIVPSLHSYELFSSLDWAPITYAYFQMHQLFVANEKKPPEIASILRTNRRKLLKFLGGFTPDKGR
jgi:hypothetical protein